jgi:hypothetical protein
MIGLPARRKEILVDTRYTRAHYAVYKSIDWAVKIVVQTTDIQIA